MELEFTLSNEANGESVSPRDTERSLREFISAKGLAERWELDHDGSVAGWGCELKTKGGHDLPRLLADFRVLSKKLTDLEAHDLASVDASAGFHVHLGVKRWTVEDLRVFYESMTASLDQWLAFQPRSRRDNRYCAANGTTDLFEHLRSSDRYYAVNLASLPEHGTIELRLFAGTLSYWKVEKTLHLLHAFIRGTLYRKEPKLLLDTIGNRKLLEFMRTRSRACWRRTSVSSILTVQRAIDRKLDPTTPEAPDNPTEESEDSLVRHLLEDIRIADRNGDIGARDMFQHRLNARRMALARRARLLASN